MKLFIIFATLFIASNVFALTDIGFKAFSTAGGTTCSVVGGHAGGERTPTSAFLPIPSSARTFDLGTKGYRVYSTAVLPGTQVLVTCYTTASTASTSATSTPVSYTHLTLPTNREV